MKIVSYIRKKPIMYKIVKPLIDFGSNVFIFFTRVPRFMEFRVLPICRKIGGRKDTQAIQELKNIHEGKRIFIIASGPSIREDDILKLKDEITIGVNGVIALYEKIGWVPTYYCLSDISVYENYEDKINKAEIQKALFGINLKKYRDRMSFKPFWYDFYLKGSLRPLTLKNVKKNICFSKDIFKEGVDLSGLMISTHALQFAVYMGASEIYLYGFDCYSGNKKHFDDKDENTNDELYSDDRKRMNDISFAFYEKAREYAEQKGINIYNATHGGILEVFERINFDSIF